MRVWATLEAGFVRAITDTYVTAVGIEPNAELVERERSKLSLLCVGDFGPRFQALLERVVRDNISNGLDYGQYIMGYGLYSGFLCRAVNAAFDKDGSPDDREAMVQHLLVCTHLEMSMAMGHFFSDLERCAAQEREGLARSFEVEVMGRLDTVDKTLHLANEDAAKVEMESASAVDRCDASVKRTLATSEQIDLVAAAAGELSASASNLAAKVDTAASASNTARDGAQSAEVTVDSLADQASRISEVVNLIRSIADQTRMLALNATIEAARAGEAGRGFAVVASEVKDLAKETSEATDRISERVEAITKTASQARTSMSSIRQAVVELDDIAGALATLGAEQKATTEEIAKSAEQTASSMRATRRDAEALAQFARSTSESSVEMKSMLGELGGASGALSSSLEAFLGDLRSRRRDHEQGAGVHGEARP